MDFANKNRDYITKAYTVELKSTYEIARDLGSNPKAIQRALVTLGVPRRSYSQAQKTALSKGTAKHPTAGRKMGEAYKLRTSEAVAKYWASLSDAEKEKKSEVGKALWEAKPAAEKEAMGKAAADACRKAAKDGSKMELYIVENLRKAGYSVEFHKIGLIPSDKLEIDIFLPELRLAIEIDGISHFEPIWGEANLQRHERSDSRKSGLLLTHGYAMLRVKQTTKTLSASKKRTVFAAILTEVEKFDKGMPPEGERYIEIEA